jgi:hypothetical protein
MEAPQVCGGFMTVLLPRKSKSFLSLPGNGIDDPDNTLREAQKQNFDNWIQTLIRGDHRLQVLNETRTTQPSSLP